MASAIDDTKPTAGTATTLSVRNNMTIAKNEISALQISVTTAQNAADTAQTAANTAQTAANTAQAAADAAQATANGRATVASVTTAQSAADAAQTAANTAQTAANTAQAAANAAQATANGRATVASVTAAQSAADAAQTAANTAQTAANTANNVHAVRPRVIDKKAVPIGVPQSGTMAANGAVTFGSAFDRIYADGVWWRFTAGAVFAGSLSTVFYYCVMSSTTVGVVYANTYTPGTDQPDIPASLTAVVDAGPGAFVGVTAEVTAASVVIPASLLGKDGVCERTVLFSAINNANNKVLNTKLGGILLGMSNSATNHRSRGYVNSFANAGVVNRQVSIGYNSDTGSGLAVGAFPSTSSIDTSAAAVHTITLQHGIAATDWIVLDRYMIKVFPT